MGRPSVTDRFAPLREADETLRDLIRRAAIIRPGLIENARMDLLNAATSPEYGVAALHAEVERLREALQKYGKHQHGDCGHGWCLCGLHGEVVRPQKKVGK